MKYCNSGVRVLAEMEGWEGIGQEELVALRQQVGWEQGAFRLELLA